MKAEFHQKLIRYTSHDADVDTDEFVSRVMFRLAQDLRDEGLLTIYTSMNGERRIEIDVVKRLEYEKVIQLLQKHWVENVILRAELESLTKKMESGTMLTTEKEPE